MNSKSLPEGNPKTRPGQRRMEGQHDDDDAGG
jgi:hypothetical protein